MDIAKACAGLLDAPKPVVDYHGGETLPATSIPYLAVPTTAGTGSEVGRASVIVDLENHVKKIIFHPRMLPQIVILDPELTFGLPPRITAATGMDALSLIERFEPPPHHRGGDPP